MPTDERVLIVNGERYLPDSEEAKAARARAVNGLRHFIDMIESGEYPDIRYACMMKGSVESDRGSITALTVELRS